MIDFNRLTDYTQTILFASQQVMARMHNTQMEPEHIMQAMSEADDGIAKDYLKELGIDNKNFQDRLLGEIQKFPRVENAVGNQQLYLCPAIKTIHTGINRNIGKWIGMSMISSMSAFDKLFIKKQDYQDIGEERFAEVSQIF